VGALAPDLVAHRLSHLRRRVPRGHARRRPCQRPPRLHPELVACAARRSSTRRYTRRRYARRGAARGLLLLLLLLLMMRPVGVILQLYGHEILFVSDAVVHQLDLQAPR